MPYITPDHYHLEIKKIEAETKPALLCIIIRCGDVDLARWDIWIPKSVIIDAEDYAKGDKNCTMCVKGWWLEKCPEFDYLLELP